MCFCLRRIGEIFGHPSLPCLILVVFSLLDQVRCIFSKEEGIWSRKGREGGYLSGLDLYSAEDLETIPRDVPGGTEYLKNFDPSRSF